MEVPTMLPVNKSLADAAKDLLDMLLSCVAENDSNVSNNGHRLLNWLHELHEQLQLLTCNFDIGLQSAKTNNLLLAIRECLLTHRWTAAFRILVSIVGKPSQYYGRCVLLLLFELCFQLHVQPDKLLVSLDSYGHLTEYVMAVDYFMYSISCNRDLATCQRALNHSERSRSNVRRCRQMKSHGTLMRQVYTGLMSYADYTCCRLSLSEGAIVLKSEESDDIRRRMEMRAEEARSQWDGLATEHGVWDTFIVKYVELLERDNNVKKCEEVLSNYMLCSSIRPNALRMLYLFRVRHGWTDSQHTSAILRELCSLVESDSLALDYYLLLLNSSPSDCGRVRLLFNRLDYAASRNCCRSWNYLSKDLTLYASEYSNDGLKEAIDECWSVRADWWPHYHFALASLPVVLSLDDEEIDLISLKAIAAFCLLSVSNQYTQTVLALVGCISKSRKSVRRLKRLLRC